MRDDGYPDPPADPPVEPPTGPVRYERVYRGNTVIGYLWCSVDGLDRGHGFVPRPEAGEHGLAALEAWRGRLAGARTAAAAIADWRDRPDDTSGALNDTDEWEAADIAELIRLAAEPEREELHAKGRARGARAERAPGAGAAGPSAYVDHTDGPVSYCPAVSGDGTVLGYLWASEADDAAGFVERAAAGTVNASNAAGAWRRRLRRAHARGLPALGALREWIGEDPAAGHDPDLAEPAATTHPEWRLAGALPPSSERQAPGLKALCRLAGDPRADL